MLENTKGAIKKKVSIEAGEKINISSEFHH
jgi:hypothetical protein